MKMEENVFDVEVLLRSLLKCQENEMLDHSCYIAAYEEILRFFDVLGTLFSFVTSDVQEKVTILKKFCEGDISDYKTIRGMLSYEVHHNITILKESNPSGARTLLRLHRALLFTVRFMHELHEADPAENLCKRVQSAYGNTLAEHHAWIVRTAVKVALHMLPTKRDLLDKLTRYDSDVTLAKISEVVHAAQGVYDTIQKWYIEYDLLNLP